MDFGGGYVVRVLLGRSMASHDEKLPVNLSTRMPSSFSLII
jgi:hypothetical protein